MLVETEIWAELGEVDRAVEVFSFGRGRFAISGGLMLLLLLLLIVFCVISGPETELQFDALYFAGRCPGGFRCRALALWNGIGGAQWIRFVDCPHMLCQCVGTGEAAVTFCKTS